MSKKMLIDAGHPEETRVVVVDGSRVDEFDFESQSKRQLRGNIYLARVTRVEPSLQAAFVEYGGNRHGFLAFSEIHPDYYQIPFEDRQRLLEEEARLASEAAERDERAGDKATEKKSAKAKDESESEDADEPSAEDDPVEEEAKARQHRRSMRSYKIQEVIKRRQILLVQVVKEERGNKGAALTTYLSLAGRYCVLMPNTARGGGISRKITSATDRKRLKKVAADLEAPEGMGLIIRTAGAKRTKTEIKRDADYLLRLWEQIRETTLKSIAPCLIYEESNLVKRAIRDLYDKDIESVLVEGDAAYREAKDFIRMLMPSHAKKVQPYRDPTPLFIRHKVEDQLEQIYNPVVQLRSGGYLVINQTEALVAIDVNSGRATRERNIEATALKTNLEAAEEACRQFRLRDLAGLIVIDFIDMDEAKNNRAVEKRMRDCLKRDRARVQAGKISSFGLMELSRQRRRASLLEGSHAECPTCRGRGLVRSVESAALRVLRAIEQEGLEGKSKLVRVRTDPHVATYLLNEKRDGLNAIEERYGMRALLVGDADLTPPAFEIERVETRRDDEARPAPVAQTRLAEDEADAAADAAAEAAEAAAAAADDDDADSEDESAGDGDRKRRRRRRRRRGGEAKSGEARADDAADDEETADGETADEDAADAAGEASDEAGDDDRPRKRRRRGRRGGRGRRSNGERETATEDAAGEEPDALRVIDPEAEAAPETPADAEPSEAAAEAEDAEAEAPKVEAAEAKPKRTRRAPRKRAPAKTAETAAAEAPAGEPEAATEPEPKAKPAPALEAELEAERAPEPEIAPEPEPEPAAAEAPAPAAPAAAEDLDAEERRKRWQNRVKTWLGG